MAEFDTYCDKLLARAKTAGWEMRNQRTIPYGRQFELSNGQSEALLNCYQGKKGLSLATGGKAASELGAALGLAPAPKFVDAAAADPFKLGMPHVGADESGKGDYFGPIVVAAWWLDQKHVDALRELGITDSKKLTDAKMQKLAGDLDKLGKGHVIRVMPRQYNPLYATVGNLNILLARLHGQCIHELLAEHGSPKAVLVDEFARDINELKASTRLPQGVKLITRTRAESDLAVAAASVLARVAFLEGLKELEQEFGAQFPPGAGDPTLKAAREFKNTYGQAQLAHVAKLHFKTTQQL